MILTRIGVLASSVGVAGGPGLVASRYADISNSNDTETQVAIDTTNALVDAGIYNKIVALYLFTGDSVSNKCFNLMDPEDIAGAFKLTVIGSPTSTSKGLRLNDASSKLFTNIYPTLIGNAEFIGAFYYVQEAGVDSPTIQVSTPAGASLSGAIYLEPHFSNKTYPQVWASSSGISTPSVPNGFHLFQRVDSSNVDYYAGATKYTDPLATNSINDGGKGICILGNGVAPYQISCFGVTQRLDASGVAALRTIITNAMTGLSRNV